MNSKVIKLGISAIVLFAISLSVYYYDNYQSNELAEGSYLILGLDTENIFNIEIAQGSSNKISFTKDVKQFVISSKGNYFSNTEKINNLLFSISNIKAYKKISTSVDDQVKYLVDNKEFRYKVTLSNNKLKSHIEFFIGNSFKNKGNYVRVAGSDEIFLSDSALSYSLSHTSYIDRRVFKNKLDDVLSMTYEGKEQLSFYRDTASKQLLVKGIKNKDVDSKKVKSVISSVLSVSLKDYMDTKSASVLKLNYDIRFKVLLNNKTQLSLALAKSKNDYYMKVSSVVSNLPSQIQLSTSDGKDKLKDVENMINAQSKSSAFNLHHGGWIYKVSKQSYDSLTLKKENFLTK